jgi:FOG: Ankyrin repeat
MVMDNKAHTALHAAVGKNPVTTRPDIVKALLERGADINSRDYRGRTPLFEACKHDLGPIMQVLLDHGADARIADRGGRTPMHEAVLRYSNIQVKRMLLEKGADVNVHDKQDRSALWYAGKRGYEDLRLLLKMVEIQTAEIINGWQSCMQLRHMVMLLLSSFSMPGQPLIQEIAETDQPCGILALRTILKLQSY